MAETGNRKNQIQHLLKKKSTVSVAELAGFLGVSEMTIRRDLGELEKEGFLRRTHGGAVREVSRSYEPPYLLRETKNREAKRSIALKAADFIEEGDTIALDTGTTVLELARVLLGFSNLTIVTASIQIGLLFLNHPGMEVILAGGKIRPGEGSLIGEITRSTFESLYFDKFFMSTGGLDARAGFTDFIHEDGVIKKGIMAHSKEVMALIDASKFERTAFYQVCPLGEVSRLITQKDPEAALKTALIENSVQIEIA